MQVSVASFGGSGIPARTLTCVSCLREARRQCVAPVLRGSTHATGHRASRTSAAEKLALPPTRETKRLQKSNASAWRACDMSPERVLHSGSPVIVKLSKTLPPSWLAAACHVAVQVWLVAVAGSLLKLLLRIPKKKSKFEKNPKLENRFLKKIRSFSLIFLGSQKQVSASSCCVKQKITRKY